MVEKELERLIDDDPDFSLIVSKKEMLVHDLVLIAKYAMTKVSEREMMWCDIINKIEKDIRKVIDDTAKKK